MESTSKKSALETIKDNLPLLSILLAVLSLSRVILYYHYFGISIVDYIELTEAVTLSVPIFIYSALGLVIGFVTGIFRWKNLHKEAAEEMNVKKGNTFKERAIAINGYIFYLVACYLFPIMVIMSVGFLFFIDKKEGIEWLLIEEIILWIYFMSGILANEIFIIIGNLTIELTTVTIRLFIIIFLFMSYFILSARADSYSVVYSNYKYLKHVNVVVGDKNISTSDNYRYVGKTKNYIFFYDIMKGSADIISLDDVKSFSILGSEPHINKSYKEDVIPAKSKFVGASVRQKVSKDTIKSKVAADTMKQKMVAKDSVKKSRQ